MLPLPFREGAGGRLNNGFYTDSYDYSYFSFIFFLPIYSGRGRGIVQLEPYYEMFTTGGLLVKKTYP
jgi:hypothetical protein